MNRVGKLLCASLLCCLLVTALVPSIANAEEGPSGNGGGCTTTSASISYAVKNSSGWTAEVTDGQTAGAGSQSIYRIKMSEPTVTTTTTTTDSEPVSTTASYDFSLNVNVAGSGWAEASLNDTGTYRSFAVPSTKKIQAIQIALSSDMSENYDIYYRVYSQTFGWLGWAKDGETAGTTGNSRCICAMQVEIVEKDATAPGTTERHYISTPNVAYKVDLAGKGWTSTSENGATSGTTSWTAKTQRVIIRTDTIFGGSILYQVRTGLSNWSSWVSNGSSAGVNGKTLQAIRIKLTGELAEYYDVYYRAYSGDSHWLGWAKDGETAGTGKINYPMGAIQVRLVAKGASAPGSTSNNYSTRVVQGGAQLTMLRKAQKFSSGTGWLILVNRSSCHVAIFSGSKYNWTLRHYWSCCVGKSSTPTIQGSYSTTGSKSYSFGEEKGYSCYYATQIYGGYLFHSILYYANTRTVMDGTMGAHVSHGCIRLTIDHAKWIYTHIFRGTKVYLY